MGYENEVIHPFRITGSYPRGMFDYVVGVGRYGFRVLAYVAILSTDKYPPFRLGA